MHRPWLRVLTDCLQTIACFEDDIEIEMGEIALGEIRPRAFAGLSRALDEEHLLSLLWLALADLAVWPQLSVPGAKTLARLLETQDFRLAHQEWGAKGAASVATECASALLPLLSELERRMRLHNIDSADLSPLRLVINRLAKESGQPVEYLEKWLRRVIPAAATTDAQRAKALALAALRCTFTAPKQWKYVAWLDAAPEAPEGTKGVRVAAVTVGRDSREVAQLGVFVNQAPVERRIATRFAPAIPVDAYRMGYLFQSTFMTDLLDDEMMGYYDSVTCKNIETEETWSYARL